MWSTARALAEPRRAASMGVIVLALLATELWATHDPLATAVLAGFAATFVFTVPGVWRWWAASPGPARLVVYLGLCASLVGLFVFALPSALSIQSYVAHPPAAPAILALVAIGGFVLGRDVEQSEGLDRAVAVNETLEEEVESARLLAIRNHLDPHFLFNTLSAIAEWCREDPVVAERALLELSTMLRTLFEGIRAPRWPLRRELDVLLALHRLFALRDDDRYRLETDIPTPVRESEASVPPLLLLPLFENAITHGLDSPMRLRLRVEDERLHFDLWNAGEYKGLREGGTGIETTRQRLRTSYDSAATLSIDAQQRDGVQGTQTLVSLPLSAAQASAADS